MKYHQQLNYNRKRRTKRRIKIAVALFVLLIVAGVGYLVYQNFQSSNFNSDEQTTSAPTSSYVAPNIQIFRSTYFQLQTTKSWTEDPNNTNTAGNKYVYRSLHNNLLEQTLTIYVNAPPKDLAVPRVLETTLNGNRGLKVEKISEHCGKAGKFTNSSFTTTLDQITFRCFGDDTRYNVLVGKIGGTTDIALPRPDGSTATYTIYYTNVTVSPDANQLTDIINSFQTR